MPSHLFSSTRPYFVLTLSSDGNPQYESPSGVMTVSLIHRQYGMAEILLSEKPKQRQHLGGRVFSMMTYKGVRYGILNQKALSRVTGTHDRIASAFIRSPCGEKEVQSFAKEAAHALRNDYAAHYGQEIPSVPLEYLVLAQMAAVRRL